MNLSATVIALCVTLGGASVAAGQSIASRVAGVSNGTVRMTFAVRPGICGGGNMIRVGTSTTQWDNDRAGVRSSQDVEWDSDCSVGPARVVIERRQSETVALRYYVGGRWRPAGAGVVDLGAVRAPDGADYLLSLASTASGKVAEKAIFPATLADSAVIWPALLRLARDGSRQRGTRNQAVFWLGQAAGEAATKNLSAIVGDNSVDQEVREAAVFALSQRPREQGVPALITVARTNRDPEIRKKALFWLGQSNDPRALDLFEELLPRR